MQVNQLHELDLSQLSFVGDALKTLRQEVGGQASTAPCLSLSLSALFIGPHLCLLSMAHIHPDAQASMALSHTSHSLNPCQHACCLTAA